MFLKRYIGVIILTTSATQQNISIIPREYVSNITISLRDDSTNVSVEYIITDATTIGNYLNFNITFSPVLVENHFYDIEIVNASKVIYRDRIFCTDQDIDQTTNDHYKLNKDQFETYDGFNNDYIVI